MEYLVIQVAGRIALLAGSLNPIMCAFLDITLNGRLRTCTVMVHPQRFFDGWTHQSGTVDVFVYHDSCIYIYILYFLYWYTYIHMNVDVSMYLCMYIYIYMLYYIHTHAFMYTCRHTHVSIQYTLGGMSCPRPPCPTKRRSARDFRPIHATVPGWTSQDYVGFWYVLNSSFPMGNIHKQHIATHIVVWKPRQQRFDSFIVIQWVLLTIQKPGGSPKVPKSLNPWGTLWQSNRTVENHHV